ncbi:hypothetical protein [Corynebacterium argentoratense]|uniref:hypothetical protein n=1 Tax=Corynebacterium argentoratense TaxID=42817 RepID=UPI00248EC254|nr:hypothetical protein [Corynebacterium argentoratense]
MGVLRFGPFVSFALGISDEYVHSVAEAVRQGADKGMFVSLAAVDGDYGGYLQVDVSVFVPEIRGDEGENLIDDHNLTWVRGITTGDVEFPVDDVLVEKLLEVMHETDGCIVLDAQDKPVLLAGRAKDLIASARRINPYEEVVFPDPSH